MSVTSPDLQSEPAAPVAQSRTWSLAHLAGAATLAAAGMAVTGDAWADIAHIVRRDEESSQVLLAPAVIAWLIWARRDRLHHCRPIDTLAGPALVALGWMFYTYGLTHLVQSFWHGGAVLVVVGCLWSVLGREVFRALLPAAVATIFLIPVPGRIRQEIALPLESGAASATQFVFDLLGVPIERAGNVLSINGVDVTVAEACNGLRMVFALFLVVYAFAFVYRLSWWARAAILLASPLLAIVCNLIRMVPTVWIYGHYSETTAERFHAVSGWVMLPIAFLLLLGGLKAGSWVMAPDGPEEEKA